MKYTIVLLFTILSYSIFGQEEKNDDSNFIATYADETCLCIDSISTSGMTAEDIADEVKTCIDKNVMVYQLSQKIFDIAKLQEDTTNQQKKFQIAVSDVRNSKEYKKYYFELERYLMEHCDGLRKKIAVEGEEGKYSFSNNSKALEWYYKGVDEDKAKKYQEAIKYYKKAVKIDPKFAFAWDNLGIAYRKTEQFDKAIFAYKKSLKIDPTGITPLQNIAVAYQYKQEYDKALDAYTKLAELDASNPEVYYGIGFVYFQYKKNNEMGLQNLCRAYNLYIEQNSPYRSDAEKLINQIYAVMKKDGKAKKFFKILKENNINTE